MTYLNWTIKSTQNEYRIKDSPSIRLLQILLNLKVVQYNDFDLTLNKI